MQPPSPSTILIIGDSLVQKSLDPSTLGFASCLAHAYSDRNVDIMVRGVSGSNSRWLLKEPGCPLDMIVAEARSKSLSICLAVLLVGANDCLLEDTPWYVPVDEYVENVRSAVERLKSDVGAERVLVLGCPPIDELAIKDTRMRRRWDRPITYSGRLSLAMKLSFLSDRSVCEIDLANVMLRKTGWCPDPAKSTSAENVLKWRGMLLDGVHLGRKGNLMVFLLIIQKIKEQWPVISPENSPHMVRTFVGVIKGLTRIGTISKEPTRSTAVSAQQRR
ncbi:SGNH hydrolase [Ascobolus immersus RN42]|uniref:SGNH hydrolase n=1 Tax=Ascobolus immersus RN42 TaxID=1160509 RepID=A0A3N4IEM4_ASCIM|nr:SGNH hydrolase [Ascobolus immersus RN42]